MADDPYARIAQLEAENAALRERDALLVKENSALLTDRIETLEQQTATAEILRIIAGAPIDARMTVILTQDGERLWLDREAPARVALRALTSYPADLMEAFAVSTAINRSGGDRPEMVEAIGS